MKIGFDNEKYLKMQSEHIMERISKFGNKLYLEFGGKLFDDYHASRVLPGFQPDSKLRMLMELRDRLLSESRQYGVYQIWKNYKLLDEQGDVEVLDGKANVNALTDLIQIVRYAYKKNQKLTSLINGYAQRFSLYCGQNQRVLSEEQKDIMQQIADYIINDGAITVMELNETDTELWKKAVKSFGGKTLASEIETLSKFILKVA